MYGLIVYDKLSQSKEEKWKMKKKNFLNDPILEKNNGLLTQLWIKLWPMKGPNREFFNTDHEYLRLRFEIFLFHWI